MHTKAEKRNPYQVMTNILKKEFKPTEEEIRGINSFMMTRWLSNHPHSIAVANYINNNHTLDIVQQYNFAYNAVHGIKYIAQRKKEVFDDEEIDVISEHYNLRYELAKEYVRMLPKELIKEIVDMYKNTGRVR